MSSIQVAKLSMRWVSAKSRPGCKNCVHGDEEREDRMPPFNTVRWRCRKAGFLTSPMAVCNEHQPKNAPASAVPPEAL